MRSCTFKLPSSEVEVFVGKSSLSVLEGVEGEAVVVHSSRVKSRVIVERMKEVASAIEIEDGEHAKDVEKVLEIVRRIFLEASPDLEWIVAVGGGTVLDVAGFVASIYRRGVKLINVPTTLLAMVDAAVGGKNAVNFCGIKNLLGTFYQPRLVICETSFLSSLPREEISNGLAEVVKYSMTLDKELCRILEDKSMEILALEDQVIEEVIWRSITNKMRIVEIDERETKGIRIVLNYGHTIGHAIEAGSDFKVPHGKAVAVGMVYEAKLANEMGFIDWSLVDFLVKLLRKYNLPTSIKDLDVKVDLDKALNAIVRDKKRRRGFINMPLLNGIASWRSVQLKVDDLEVYLKRCLEG